MTMKYVAYDSCRNVYLCRMGRESSKYSIVSDIEQATKWDKKKTVDNVIKNLGKKFKQYSFEARNQVAVSSELPDFDAQVELDYDIIDKVKEIETCVKQIEARKEFLAVEMSRIDLEIVDIEHAAEFYNLNAAQGYKLYKMLHDARIERRSIKNEMEKLNYFLNTKLNSYNLMNLKSSINGMNNRQYTPRVNNQLFGV